MSSESGGLPDWIKHNDALYASTFSAAEKQRVIDLAYQRKTAAEIAKALGRTAEEIRAVRSELKIPAWTEASSGLIGGTSGPVEVSEEFRAWQRNIDAQRAAAAKNQPSKESEKPWWRI